MSLQSIDNKPCRMALHIVALEALMKILAAEFCIGRSETQGHCKPEMSCQSIVHGHKFFNWKMKRILGQNREVAIVVYFHHLVDALCAR